MTWGFGVIYDFFSIFYHISVQEVGGTLIVENGLMVMTGAESVE
jgi:hypothetical protein